MKSCNFIKKLLSDLKIPKNKILVLHVKLKNIYSKTGYNYKDLTEMIINNLTKEYNPLTILTPTFTYTFTKSGVFHRLYSKSETGRFSEETRMNFSKYRTCNPIFSFADVEGYFRNINLDNKKAFGKNTIFDHLDNKDCIIVKIGLEKLVGTQLHHIQKLCDVSYRYNKEFSGVVYYNKKDFKMIKYNYFVRDLNKNPQWDKLKIKNKLYSKDELFVKRQKNIEVNWINSLDLKNVMSEILNNDDKWILK